MFDLNIRTVTIYVTMYGEGLQARVCFADRTDGLFYQETFNGAWLLLKLKEGK